MSMFTPRAKAPTQSPASFEKRLESLKSERSQLMEDAQRFGISADSESPVALSHNRVISKIDAEIELLESRVGAAKPKAKVEPAAVSSDAAAPKQIIKRMPDKRGVYPPGTFLDIYA